MRRTRKGGEGERVMTGASSPCSAPAMECGGRAVSPVLHSCTAASRSLVSRHVPLVAGDLHQRRSRGKAWNSFMPNGFSIGWRGGDSCRSAVGRRPQATGRRAASEGIAFKTVLSRTRIATINRDYSPRSKYMHITPYFGSRSKYMHKPPYFGIFLFAN
ncbi:hypothetical protein SEVIR_2G396832v4 [Setaria viridis]